MTVCFSVLLFFTALALTYVSYLPIRRIFGRYTALQIESSAHSGDELAILDSALSASIRRHRLSEEQADQLQHQIVHQKQNLKDYLLLALLNGECSEKTLAALGSLSISLLGPCLSVVVLRFADAVSPEESDRLIVSIERLSSDDLRCYAIKIDIQPIFLLLVSADRSDQIVQLGDILAEISDIEVHQQPRVSYGSIVSSLTSLPDSLSAAITVSRIDVPQETASLDSQTAALKDAIMREDTAAIWKALDSLNKTLPLRCPSLLAQRCVYADVVSTLVQAAHGKGLSVSSETLAALNGAPLSEDCQSAVRSVVDMLCSPPLDDDQSDPRCQLIMTYIGEHILDYDLSLESLSQTFALSGRQITRLIARETGLSYKDYLIEQRIEYAKHLLLSGASVSSVCDLLHYASIPYFIKLFHSKTGVTPAKYKKQHDDGIL